VWLTNKKMILKFQKINPEAKIPRYVHHGDAAMDIRSIEPYEIHPKKTALIKTGLKVQIPFGYEAQIRPRSGLALKHGITIPNSPGTIDSGYRGEVCIILRNHSDELFKIEKHDRIAQMLITKHEIPHIEEVKELDSSEERQEKSFGSSGVK